MHFIVFIITALVFALALVGAMFLLYQLVTNFQPSSNKVNQDIQQLKRELANWTAELIPWKEEDLELLSVNQTNQTITKRVTKMIKGVFTSIYHEPMIAYAYKKYVGSSSENAVVYATTADHEFVYRIKKKEIQLQIDGRHVGVLKNGAQLYNAQNNKLVAKIDRNKHGGNLPLLLGDREIANLAPPSENPTTSSRAFEYVNDGLEDNEKLVLLSLTTLELISREVKRNE